MTIDPAIFNAPTLAKVSVLTCKHRMLALLGFVTLHIRYCCVPPAKLKQIGRAQYALSYIACAK
eukprot:1212-Heterococcus_DN1.PRE.2